jgi:hypothetical protein
MNIAAALGTDIYRLFTSESIHEAEQYRTVLLDLTETFKKIRADFDLSLENALELWGMGKKNKGDCYRLSWTLKHKPFFG